MSSCSSSPEIDQAREHLKKAAEAFGDRLIGKDTAHHLRQAARSALLAGVSAIDKAEARQAKPAEHQAS